MTQKGHKQGEATIYNGWVVRKSGLSATDHKILFLPGALMPANSYDDLISELMLAKASLGFVLTTLPGNAGTPALDNFSIECTAKSACKLAVNFDCDVVVGHSLGANIALEMAASGEFNGPIVLLSPSFSRKDESKFPRALDRLSLVFGHLPYSLMFAMIGPAFKRSFPPKRADGLIAEMKKNNPRVVQKGTRLYLKYLDHHVSLVSRLGESDAKAWVVFGDKGDVGLSDDERRGLEAYDSVSLVTISGTGHFAILEKPHQVANVVLEAVSKQKTK